MRAETDVPSGEATTRAVGGSQCAVQPGAQLARLAQRRAASRQLQTLADNADARAHWQALQAARRRRAAERRRRTPPTIMTQRFTWQR
jgi:hypothetical protein